MRCRTQSECALRHYAEHRANLDERDFHLHNDQHGHDVQQEPHDVPENRIQPETAQTRHFACPEEAHAHKVPEQQRHWHILQLQPRA